MVKVTAPSVQPSPRSPDQRLRDLDEATEAVLINRVMDATLRVALNYPTRGRAERRLRRARAALAAFKGYEIRAYGSTLTLTAAEAREAGLA